MSISRTSSPDLPSGRSVELLVSIDRGDPRSFHRQLEHALRDAVRSGRLAPAAALPSSRALAGQLGISRGVVVEAYEQLVAEGYLTSLPGGATRVTEAATTPRRAPIAPSGGPAPSISFAYGRPDVVEFPRRAWLRSLRRVLDQTPSERLSYLDARGAPELREALGSYLDRVRGTVADPERIVICNGFAQGLGLVLQVLKENGAKRVAIEDPGQDDAVVAARRLGLDVVPIPVDDDGIVVESLARTDAPAVIVTPAHQFPTGAVLSPERRAALEAWASTGDRLILEDDYDAEFRYDREPIGALQGLAHEHVVYAGSASKTLAPGLRLGWLVAPSALVGPLAAMKTATDRGSPSLEQLAFADFLVHGDFDRHLRHMRPIYRDRRDALLGALAAHLPMLRPAGASAGLHVLAWLPDGMDEAAVIACAAAAGVKVEGVRQHYVEHDGPGGLLFGYGAVPVARIEEGVRVIAAAIAEG